MLTVYQGNEYWEFIVQPDETINFIYEKADESKLSEEGLPYSACIVRFEEQPYGPSD